LEEKMTTRGNEARLTLSREVVRTLAARTKIRTGIAGPNHALPTVGSCDRDCFGMATMQVQSFFECHSNEATCPMPHCGQ
jgi:hypothetical protein